MQFETNVRGVKCICDVTEYTAGSPMVVTGTGFGDAEPPEEEEFEFIIRGVEGNRRMKALEEQVTPTIRARLIREYKDQLLDF